MGESGREGGRRNERERERVQVERTKRQEEETKKRREEPEASKQLITETEKDFGRTKRDDVDSIGREKRSKRPKPKNESRESKVH